MYEYDNQQGNCKIDFNFKFRSSQEHKWKTNWELIEIIYAKNVEIELIRVCEEEMRLKFKNFIIFCEMKEISIDFCVCSAYLWHH